MKDQKLTCALISVDPDFRNAVTEIVEDPGRSVELALDISSSVNDLRRDALDMVRRAEPDVVLLDLGDDPVLGLMFVRALTEEVPDQLVVLAGPKLEAEPLLEVMRAGAAEYLPKPVDQGDVAGALARIARKARGATEKAPSRSGRMISVFSAKGGVGASTTATNLATHLARITGKRTLLIDLDVEMGAVALLLGLRPRYSFVDLIENFHRLDEGLLESYVERHKKSGLYVLSAPPLAEGLTVTREQTRTLLEFVREHFEFVVLDLEKGLAPVTMVGLEQSDVCLVVATPELPTLRNVKRVLPTVERAIGTGEKVRIVLNQYREGLGIGVDDVQNTLGHDVFWTLDRDDAVAHSVNVGKPLVLNGTSKYGKSIKAMGLELSGLAPKATGLKGRLGSIFRRKKEGSGEPAD